MKTLSKNKSYEKTNKGIYHHHHNHYRHHHQHQTPSPFIPTYIMSCNFTTFITEYSHSIQHVQHISIKSSY